MKVLQSAVFVLLSFSAFAVQAHFFDEEDEPKKRPQLKPALTYVAGNNSYEAQLGLGFWNEDKTEHSQFYLSHFQSEDNLKVKHTDLGKQKYTSSRVGFQVQGFGFTPAGASQASIFIYKNRSEANLDRLGFGLNLLLGKMLTDNLRVHLGADVMPEFLSTDWDAKAFLQYQLNTGLTYRLV